MGKQKKDPVEKARRKLDKSQRAFHSAEEKHAQARARGRQEIEKARLRAARWQAKASELLERRAAAVARAEERLLVLTGGADMAAQSPETVATMLEERSADGHGGGDDRGIIIPDSSELRDHSDTQQGSSSAE